MSSLSWLKYHFTCPNFGVLNEKKSRKRDKSEVGLDTPPEIDSNRHIESSFVANTINAYYNKHLDKHYKREQNQEDNRKQQETIANKIKNKIPFGTSKESKSLTSLQPSRLLSSSSSKASKKSTNQNCINQNLSSLDLNKTTTSSHSTPSTNSKLVTLPFDKKTRNNLDTSLVSTHSNTSTNSSCSRTLSNTSSTTSSTGADSSNPIDLFLKNYIGYETNPHSNCNMIMTTSNKTLAFPVSSSSSSLTTGSNSFQSSPVIQQPQFVANSNSNLNMSSSSLSSPITPTSTNTILPPTPSTNGTPTDKNANNKISSLSYLDDSNLKIACVDPNDLAKLVKLQNLIDLNEWLAFNSEHCTQQTCPTMNAPSNSQFYWLDEKGKKHKYSAPQYIDTVLTYGSKIISDELLFPISNGHSFPSNFEQLVKRIHKHLFHILAHMYHSHYKELVQLKLNSYINSIYFHLYLFSKNFNTIEDKDLEIMDALNKALVNKYIDCSSQQQQLLLNQQPPTIHQPTTSSSSSSGFSFFKKKLNFNLMA